MVDVDTERRMLSGEYVELDELEGALPPKLGLWSRFAQGLLDLLVRTDTSNVVRF